MEIWLAAIGFVLTGALMMAITLLVQRALARTGGASVLNKPQRQQEGKSSVMSQHREFLHSKMFNR